MADSEAGGMSWCSPASPLPRVILQHPAPGEHTGNRSPRSQGAGSQEPPTHPRCVSAPPSAQHPADLGWGATPRGQIKPRAPLLVHMPQTLRPTHGLQHKNVESAARKWGSRSESSGEPAWVTVGGGAEMSPPTAQLNRRTAVTRPNPTSHPSGAMSPLCPALTSLNASKNNPILGTRSPHDTNGETETQRRALSLPQKAPAPTCPQGSVCPVTFRTEVGVRWQHTALALHSQAAGGVGRGA